jgi:hypothetical protein
MTSRAKACRLTIYGMRNNFRSPGHARAPAAHGRDETYSETLQALLP